MAQLLSLWTALDARRRVIVTLAALAAIAAVVGLAQVATTPRMALLYSGLDPAAAGEVIAALEESSTAYEVRDSGIYVASTDRDRIRMTLAARGLPAAGAAGYELLDELTGFGTTSQMFDAAYWRAREGELARTILATPGVRSARVHIAVPPKQPFARNAPTTASVTVTMSGNGLDAGHAKAIRYLVASAVAGLAPEQVSVIDSAAGVILQAGSGDSPDPLGDGGDSRAEQMKANVERLLEARVGPGRAVVEIMIDADMDSQTIVERVIDPSSRVAISSDTEETSDSQQGSDSGAVTVASNLPSGDAGNQGGSSSSASSQTRERLNFEVSETRRERVIQPGQIRRITAAVLVDGIATEAAGGDRNWAPRSEEELASLRALVESAIGFDAARGDVVTLQSLEFPQAGSGGTVADSGSGILSTVTSYVPSALLALVALVLGLFVVRPILLRSPSADAGDPVLVGAGEVVEGSSGHSDRTQSLPSPQDSKVTNLRKVITERYDESADVLRRWIEAPDKTKEQG